MNFPTEQLEELKNLYSNVQIAEEGGSTFFLLPNLKLPDGCNPNRVDALFCPTQHGGYASRLYFSEKFIGGPNRNWNGQFHLLDRNWFAISWKINQDQRIVQMISSHLDAFRS